MVHLGNYATEQVELDASSFESSSSLCVPQFRKVFISGQNPPLFTPKVDTPASGDGGNSGGDGNSGSGDNTDSGNSDKEKDVASDDLASGATKAHINEAKEAIRGYIAARLQYEKLARDEYVRYNLESLVTFSI